jgi:hypothetical protein
MIHDDALIIQYEKYDQKCEYKYLNLLYYRKRSLLHVSATHCGHLQGGLLRRIYYIERQNDFMYKYKILRTPL